MKIIPAIDLMDGQVVRLYKGDPKQKTVYSKDPVSVAKKWQDAGADMLHIVDLDATIGTGSNLDLIEQISKELSIPVEVAGGLRSEEIIDRTISFSNRVVIGTLAFKDKELLQRLQKETADKIYDMCKESMLQREHEAGEEPLWRRVMRSL